MNILYTASLYPPSMGGAQSHLHRLAMEVQRAGHQVRVVTNGARDRHDWVRLATFLAEPADERMHDGVPVHTLGYTAAARAAMLPWASTYYAQIGRATRHLADLIRPELDRVAGQPELIHASRIGREFLTRASLDLARQRGIPFVLTPNHHPRWDGWRYVEFDRIYREADALIALTEAEKHLLIEQKGVPEERIHINGIAPILADTFSVEAFRSERHIEGPFVLFLGQQLPYKGIDALLAAAPKVWNVHPDTRFVFIGPTTSYSRKLFRVTDDRRLINLGRVDLPTKTAALAACEMLCLPSSQESFGGVFTEAWSMGKPVIGGRIPAIECVIDEGTDGLLCRQDGDELARAIDRLLADQPAARAMGQAGLDKVRRYYTQQRITERMINIYRAAIG